MLRDVVSVGLMLLISLGVIVTYWLAIDDDEPASFS